VEVGKQGEPETAEAEVVDLVGEDAVDAQAEDLGVGVVEGAPGRPKGGQFGASAACEIENIESEEYVLVAPVLTQGYVPALSAFKCKVGGFLSYLDLVRHD
jgi:predicted transcriptional regulator